MNNASPSIMQRTARGAGWMLAWRLSSRLLGLVSTLILVRILTPEDFGIVSLAFAFAGALEAGSAIGTEAQLVRSHDPPREMYDTAFTMNLCRALLLMVVIAATAVPAAAWFGDRRLVDVLRIIALLSGLNGLANIRLVDFQRNLDFRQEFIALGLPRLLQVGFTITFCLWLRSYWGMLYGLCAGRASGIVCGYLLRPHRPRLTLSAWRLLLSASAWTWGTNLAMMIRDRTDVLVIGRILGTEAVGFWAVSVEIAALPLSELVTPITRAAMPGFAATLRAQGRPEAAAAFLRVLGLIVVVVVPTGVGMSLVAGPLVAVALGRTWHAASLLITIVGVMFIPMAPGLISNAMLIAQGRFRDLCVVMSGSAVLRVAAVWGFGRHYGLPGIAVAVGLSLLAEQFLLTGRAAWLARLRPAALAGVLWRPPLAAAAMAGIVWLAGLGWLPPPSDAVAAAPLLAAGAAVGALAFVAALALVWLAAGRPAGAETDLLGLVRQAAAPLLRRRRA